MIFQEKIYAHKKGKKEARRIQRKSKTFSNMDCLFGFIHLPVFWSITRTWANFLEQVKDPFLFVFYCITGLQCIKVCFSFTEEPHKSSVLNPLSESCKRKQYESQ